MSKVDPEDDPLAYMTADSPSGSLWESRLPMMARYARGSRGQSGWRRVVVVLVRIAFAVLLLFFLAGFINGVMSILRQF